MHGNRNGVEFIEDWFRLAPLNELGGDYDK